MDGRHITRRHCRIAVQCQRTAPNLGLGIAENHIGGNQRICSQRSTTTRFVVRKATSNTRFNGTAQGRTNPGRLQRFNLLVASGNQMHTIEIRCNRTAHVIAHHNSTHRHA